MSTETKTASPTWGNRMVMLTAFLVVPLFSYGLSSLRTHSGNYDAEIFQNRYGEWAIVAGASEGLGAAWADELCGYGINVLLVARREKLMTELAQRLMKKHSSLQEDGGGGCQMVDTMVQDLSAAPKVLEKKFAKILDSASRKFGLLVYNAAYSPAGNFLEKELQGQMLAVDLNIRGLLTLTHLFSNYLISRSKQDNENRGGGIIMMSSLAGVVGTGTVANYAATKSWINSFAQATSWEFQQMYKSGGIKVPIDVLSCMAGATKTPNYEKFSGSSRGIIKTVQDPEEVVTECMQAIGVYPSVATGPLNKFVRFLFSRILPPAMAVDIISSETSRRNN